MSSSAPAFRLRAADAIEDAGGVALAQLTECLNEAQLRPLLLRALAFGSDYSSNDATGAHAAPDASDASDGGLACKGDGDGNGRGAVSPHRALSFFRLLCPSQDRFAAISAPLFEIGLPLAAKVWC